MKQTLSTIPSPSLREMIEPFRPDFFQTQRFTHQLQVWIVIKEESCCGKILLVARHIQAELDAHLVKRIWNKQDLLPSFHLIISLQLYGDANLHKATCMKAGTLTSFSSLAHLAPVMLSWGRATMPWTGIDSLLFEMSTMTTSITNGQNPS